MSVYMGIDQVEMEGVVIHTGYSQFSLATSECVDCSQTTYDITSSPNTYREIADSDTFLYYF